MNKYLITGGCGFIGSNYIHYLIDNKLSSLVINIDKLTYAGNKENLYSVSKQKDYHFIEGDIADRKVVRATLESFDPDVIVNFAAESHVDRSIDKPEEFFQTNILGTLNLLDEAKNWLKKSNREKRKSFKFIHISTDEVYGSLGEKGKFLENTPYNPSSPYSASKAGSDHLVRSWYKTYNFPVMITNCSNNYGPYQFPEKLIPLMIINAIKMKKLPIYGNGLNIRDWLYVHDHCDAIQRVVEKGKLGETYNIGGKNEITNIQIVKNICTILDDQTPLKTGRSYSEQIVFVEDRPGHDFRYAIDSSKIEKNLGWKPRESFETGIKKTIIWYLSNNSWFENILYKQERLGIIKQ